MSVWLVSFILALATPSLGYPIMENVSQVRRDPRAGSPMEGTHPLIANGTDEGLYNEGFFEGDIVLPRTDNITIQAAVRNAVTDSNLLWPSAAVIYTTSQNFGCPNSRQCHILMGAMNHYHERSCIRFKEWTGEPNHVEVFVNTDSGACWSSVGRTGEVPQLLSLGQRCWSHGIVVHELGHAVGFWHEMNRPDRDDWIYIYEKNIMENFTFAFVKLKAKDVTTFGERFDYRSIMMYHETAFSKDGVSKTLEAKTGERIGPVWEKPGLSASDQRRVHKLYKCDGNKQKVNFPYDIVCDFNRHTCGFHNEGSNGWRWGKFDANNGYVFSSHDLVGVTSGSFVSTNLHAISGQDKRRGPLGCIRFQYLMEGKGGASLKLQQAYLNKTTQLTYSTKNVIDLWHSDKVTNKWVHVDLSMYITRPFKLIFHSKFERGATHGTIALENVEILYSHCPRYSSHRSGPLPFSASPPANSSAIPVSAASLNIERDPNI